MLTRADPTVTRADPTVALCVAQEVRYPVILTNNEKLIARKVCQAFKQTVCGFDLLR